MKGALIKVVKGRAIHASIEFSHFIYLLLLFIILQDKLQYALPTRGGGDQDQSPQKNPTAWEEQQKMPTARTKQKNNLFYLSPYKGGPNPTAN